MGSDLFQVCNYVFFIFIFVFGFKKKLLVRTSDECYKTFEKNLKEVCVCVLLYLLASSIFPRYSSCEIVLRPSSAIETSRLVSSRPLLLLLLSRSHHLRPARGNRRRGKRVV